MIEQKQKEIDGITYYVTQLDAFSGLQIQTKLIKILGPAAIPVIEKSINSVSELKKNLAHILPSLLNNFDDKVLNEFILSLFKRNIFYLEGDKKLPVDFASHFTGKILRIWKVAYFILEVNLSLGEFIKSDSPTTEEAKEKKES